MRTLHASAVALVWLIVSCSVAETTTVTVFDKAMVQFDETLPEEGDPSKRGRLIRKSVALPPPPESHCDDQRITATVHVQPRMTDSNGPPQPADPWTRFGNILLLIPADGEDGPLAIELMRFVTGYGGATTFTADLTPFAPLLYGKRTVAAFVDTWAKRGWKVSLELTYSDKGIGIRRPEWVQPVFNESHVDEDNSKLSTTIQVPAGLDLPRIRILSTGHGSEGPDEFLTRTHVLRVDGRDVARWRPWNERGSMVRTKNPKAGRKNIKGRTVWASDLDRSGWTPGEVVEPLVFPLPELSPGRHRLTLEIVDFTREPLPTEETFWRISAVIVADDPWPVKKTTPQKRKNAESK